MGIFFIKFSLTFPDGLIESYGEMDENGVIFNGFLCLQKKNEPNWKRGLLLLWYAYGPYGCCHHPYLEIVVVTDSDVFYWVFLESCWPKHGVEWKKTFFWIKIEDGKALLLSIILFPKMLSLVLYCWLGSYLYLFWINFGCENQ